MFQALINSSLLAVAAGSVYSITQLLEAFNHLVK